MSLLPLQEFLERIYSIAVHHKVDDFIISDPELARTLDRSVNCREVKEKLLVSEDGEFLDLSLYIDPDVLGHLMEDDPIQCLHDGNLNDFLNRIGRCESLSLFDLECFGR